MTRRRIAGSVAASAVLLMGTSPVSASTVALARAGASGTTTRVSVNSSGTQGDSISQRAATSADGRFVAFMSEASNLVPGDTNGVADIFVRDRWTGTTRRVSVGARRAEANDVSDSPTISASGRFVAFWSLATNLVPDDTNHDGDAFVHDRWTGTTRRVSVGLHGTQANEYAYLPMISANGRFVAFESFATNLVPRDTNQESDVFLRDRSTGTTQLVSVSFDGRQANAESRVGSISPNGRYVVFTSTASNLVAGDTNGTADVFLRDRWTETTRRVSVSFIGTQGNAESAAGPMSADGRFVVFNSSASNLVPGDTNNEWEVFAWDRQTGTSERVSIGAGGAQVDNFTFVYSGGISANGRFVVFESWATTLSPDETNGFQDIFVRDRWTGDTRRVSVS